MARLRIEAMASFISFEEKVVDIGCDHAYLAIYLMQNEMCQKVLATDIHENALLQAKKNIRKVGLEKKIPTLLSDGFTNITEDVDTAVISGMGTSTILHIIRDTQPKGIKKYILQANNDLYLLRTSLEKLGYFLEQERIVYEKGHYYVIGLYTLSGKRLTLREKYFGKYDVKQISYYKDMHQNLSFIYKQLRFKEMKKKVKIYIQLQLLKKYL